jgi:hypothetical protein
MKIGQQETPKKYNIKMKNFITSRNEDVKVKAGDKIIIEKWLQSSKIEKQLIALQSIFEMVVHSKTLSNFNILSNIVENCLGSENGNIRLLSFKIILLLYRNNNFLIPWKNIQVSVITEFADILGSKNHKLLSILFGILNSIGNDELVKFFITTDPTPIIQIYKNIFQIDDPKIQNISILNIGSITLKLIKLLDSNQFDFESYDKFESFSDARRSRDEIIEFIYQFIHYCDDVVIGNKSLSDTDNEVKIQDANIETFECCCKILFDYISYYNSCSISSNKYLQRIIINDNYEVNTTELSKIVNFIIKGMFPDNYALLMTKKQYPRSKLLSDLISQIILVLLYDINSEINSTSSNLFQIISYKNNNMFSFKNEEMDETILSRQNSIRMLSFQQFVYEWIHNHLIHEVQGLTISVETVLPTSYSHKYMYRVSKLFEIISITQHRLFRNWREKVDIILKENLSRLSNI